MLVLDDLAVGIELEEVREIGWTSGWRSSGRLDLDRNNPPVWRLPQLVRSAHKTMDPARHGGHPTHGGRSHSTVYGNHRPREGLREQGPVEGPDDDENQDEDYQGKKWFHHNTTTRSARATPAATTYGPTEVLCARTCEARSRSWKASPRAKLTWFRAREIRGTSSG